MAVSGGALFSNAIQKNATRFIRYGIMDERVLRRDLPSLHGIRTLGRRVQALAGEFSKKLAAQGWKSDRSGDLVTPRSAILKRTRGEASLTIVVKPADKGSAVTIMTEGLDWEEKEE